MVPDDLWITLVPRPTRLLVRQHNILLDRWVASCWGSLWFRWAARGKTCVADSCKHPCTQSAQRLQFACSNFHENKKPFLIGYFGLVWHAPFDWPKIMITLESRAYNKNKCNLISRSGGGADLLTWCLIIHVDNSFSIRWLIRHFSVMHARFTSRRPPIKISSKRGQNCTRKHTRVSLELLKL